MEGGCNPKVTNLFWQCRRKWQKSVVKFCRSIFKHVMFPGLKHNDTPTHWIRNALPSPDQTPAIYSSRWSGSENPPEKPRTARNQNTVGLCGMKSNEKVTQKGFEKRKEEIQKLQQGQQRPTWIGRSPVLVTSSSSNERPALSSTPPWQCELRYVEIIFKNLQSPESLCKKCQADTSFRHISNWPWRWVCCTCLWWEILTVLQKPFQRSMGQSLTKRTFHFHFTSLKTYGSFRFSNPSGHAYHIPPRLQSLCPAPVFQQKDKTAKAGSQAV